MPIDFPNSPTNGQTFTVGDTTWVYNNGVWSILTSSASYSICTSSSRPASPGEGRMIFETDTNFIRVYDGSNWIFVSNVTGGTTATTVPYSYVDTVYFTSSGTFSKGSYSWLRAINVKLVGGGGGSAGTSYSADGTNANASSGGAGAGYAEKFITDIAGLAASETITIGAAGAAGGSPGNGGSGGNTTAFGLTGNGGAGGTYFGQSTNGQARKTTGGTATGGDINISGQQGGPGWSVSGKGVGGPGGSSMLGQGGAGGVTSAVPDTDSGGAGTGYGAGAGGRGSRGGNEPGLAGQPGIVIVELYA